jgi:hypothetical protein
MPVPLSTRRHRMHGLAVAAFALFALAAPLSAIPAASAATTASSCKPIDQITALTIPKAQRTSGVIGGQSTTVTMFFITPTACATAIRLHNFDTTVASIPGAADPDGTFTQIVVPEGSKSASFTVDTVPVSAPTTVQIVANEVGATSATETGVEFSVVP